MATDSPNTIVYYLSIEANYQEHLGTIRDWGNLKMAKEENLIWLTGFTTDQLNSLAVQHLPYKKVYYAEGTKLFPKGSLLPNRNLPALLWTAINRGVPVQLPDFNHNYFGLKQQVNIQLKQTSQEKEAVALFVSLELLGKYIMTAPAIRLKPLTWVIIDQENALLMGTPLLPIKGKAYWKSQSSLLPLGYDFEYTILHTTINKLLSPSGADWLIWHEDNRYTKISQEQFQVLSMSSYRKSIQT